MADATVVCWGANDWGQLGHEPGAEGDDSCRADNITYCNSRPCKVPGLTGAVEVVVGADVDGTHGFSCARLSDGSVYCWGDNSMGQVTTPRSRGGPGPDRIPHPIPAQVTLSGTAEQLTASGLFACATLGGRVSCWGEMNSDRRPMPEFVPMLSLGDKGSSIPLDETSTLASGHIHLCGIRRAGVYCYGTNYVRQLGREDEAVFDSPCMVDGQPANCSVAANPVAGITSATSIAAGINHTCVLLKDRSVRCWGSNSTQQLGDKIDPSTGPRPISTPVKVQGLP